MKRMQCSRCGTPLTEVDEHTDTRGVVIVRCPQCGHEAAKAPEAAADAWRAAMQIPRTSQLNTVNVERKLFYGLMGAASAPLCGVLVGATAQHYGGAQVHGTPISFMVYAPFGALLGLGLGAAFAVLTIKLKSELLLALCCLVVVASGTVFPPLLLLFGSGKMMVVFMTLGCLGAGVLAWRWGRKLMAPRP